MLAFSVCVTGHLEICRALLKSPALDLVTWMNLGETVSFLGTDDEAVGVGQTRPNCHFNIFQLSNARYEKNFGSLRKGFLFASFALLFGQWVTTMQGHVEVNARLL